MKKERFSLTISEIIENEKNGIPNGNSPLNIGVIPNYMGINLCSVDRIEWEKLEDGQLTNLTIVFIPNLEEI